MLLLIKGKVIVVGFEEFLEIVSLKRFLKLFLNFPAELKSPTPRIVS